MGLDHQFFQLRNGPSRTLHSVQILQWHIHTPTFLNSLDVVALFEISAELVITRGYETVNRRAEIV